MSLGKGAGLRAGGLLPDAFSWQSEYDGRVCEPAGPGQRDTKQK